ncbi:MAG: DUF695 domain-containing protein [Chitinophagaceae bacterium]|nr:DUF695 domain-containing protein [Chitinophagaceae bacterium]
MSFIRKMFGSKQDIPRVDNSSFWKWFTENEKQFFRVIKNNDRIDEKFLQKVMDKLEQLNNKFYCLAGMYDENTAELVVTPEGNIKTIVFAEELIAAAPSLEGWRFTALKPAIGFDQVSIEMDGYQFNEETLRFFSTVQPDYPDEIDITLVHKDFNEENETIIRNGSLIYLDNALGELNSVTMIDTLHIEGQKPADTELISMSKLPDFLQWREKEFLEKYKGTRYNTENDSYYSMEAQDENGLPVLAILNQELMEWDSKASHPWLMLIEIKYDGKDTNGMPDDEDYELMDEFEEKLISELPDAEGYLNIGRETTNSTRTIYFACKEFRRSSKAAHTLIEEYLDRLEITYDIYKDKYWMTMNKYK